MYIYKIEYIFCAFYFLRGAIYFKFLPYSSNGGILDREARSTLAFWFRLLCGSVQRSDGIENRYDVSFVVLSAFKKMKT